MIKSLWAEMSVFAKQLFFLSQLGEYSPFFRDLVSSTTKEKQNKHILPCTFTDCFLWFMNFNLKENEVAEVQPPPVILYPQSHDQSHNNGAGHYSQGGSVIRPIEPPPHPPVDPRYPPQYDPRFPDPRHTGQTDGRLATHHTENRYPVTPRRPSPPVPQPAGRVDPPASGVSRFHRERLWIPMSVS